MIIILMGVSGSGKTLIGKLLAEDLGWTFYDGDDFHPSSNIEKMKHGTSLTDEDRFPWLDAIYAHMMALARRGEQAVIACSALKQSYRERLLKGCDSGRLVYLRGDFGVIQQRLRGRKGHFFNAAMLTSQFQTLEEPEGVVEADISQDPVTIVSFIKGRLVLPARGASQKTSKSSDGDVR